MKRLGDERKLSTPELLDGLTRRAEEDQLLFDHEFVMRQIMADPDRAESYRAELSAWDLTVSATRTAAAARAG